MSYRRFLKYSISKVIPNTPTKKYLDLLLCYFKFMISKKERVYPTSFFPCKLNSDEWPIFSHPLWWIKQVVSIKR